jgi:prepilin-type N-terminal cleavage/methylation domain-containing protein
MVRHSRGFTLIELLVVITIIGILVGLMMPAVNAAREAGRRATCSNNIKQLSLGCIAHAAKYGYFPSGGWGHMWEGMPDRGNGQSQPGGWVYNVLPFIDNSVLHDLGKGASSTDARIANARRIQTPLPLLNCPTRRQAQVYLVTSGYSQPRECEKVTAVARTDYAINGGSNSISAHAGPGSLDAGDSYDWPSMTNFNGICGVRSEVREGSVADGLSNTYLVGEKYLNPDDYTSGEDQGDDQNAYSGDCLDIVRWGSTSWVPMQDRLGVANANIFGSAHAAGWNVSMCDGSVRLMSFNIDPTTHEHLAIRNDHTAIDPTFLQ